MHLYRTVEQWTKTLRVGAVERVREDEVLSAALDSFSSDFVDRWMSPVRDAALEPDWWSAARALGFQRLSDRNAAGSEGVPLTSLVRELFAASREAPDAGEPWVGHGWRVFSPTTEQGSRLYEAWVALCDGTHQDQIMRIRRAREVDLGMALEIDAPVALEVASHRDRVGFRFKNLDSGEVIL